MSISKKNRVFVIGSGFSASMGLPTLSGLFEKIMNFSERPGETDKKKIRTALDFLYPHFYSGITSPSYPPFEEFFSLVYAAEDFSFFWKGTWQDWRDSALRLLTDFMADRSKGAENHPLLCKFADNLKEGDVIITFNWDTLIERELFKQSKKMNFKARDEGAISILKLHGSLNWLEIPESLSLKHPAAVRRLADNVVYSPDYTYYNIWDVLNSPPLIVPPGLSKRVIVNSPIFFKDIWNEAFQSLNNADNVTFIGYSIPRDDIQARSLLTIGWYSRLHGTKEPIKYVLVDPNPEICRRYASIISNDFIYHQTYFNEDILPILFKK